MLCASSQCVETTAMVLHILQVLQLDIGTVKKTLSPNWALIKHLTLRWMMTNRKKLLKGWKKAVKCSYGWAKRRLVRLDLINKN